MSELREAAQAVVDELADWISNGLIADLRAALAQPESEAHPPRDEWRPASEPPTESTIATEIKAARDELATWSKERQDAARVSAVAMTPPTTEECSGFCHPDEPRCVITEDGKCDAGNPQRGAR